MSNTTNTSIKNKVHSLFKYWYLLVVLVFIGSILARSADAASFSQSYLRLDRTKANTALSGLVCAKPSSSGAGTEAKVSITFPSDFTINASPSNHTTSTSTSNLPSGATSWPSIGSSAQSVSGQTVTFSGGDLTSSSSLYCFNFTSSSSTTGGTGTKTGTIAAKSSGDTIIDSSEYAVSIVSSDQITVSATVPANASNFQILLDPVPQQSEFRQGDVIPYEITYGSNSPNPSNIIIEAEWHQGILEGGTAPNIDIVEYFPGSATSTDNGISPFIDIGNNKVVWTINNFPSQTLNKKVYFALRLRDVYQGESKVNFTVSARIISGGAVTPDKNVAKSYRYNKNTSSSSSSTSTSTSTSTSALQGIPQRVRPPSSPFRDIFIPGVSQTEVKIFIESLLKGNPSIRYGTHPRSLSNAVTSLNKDKRQTIDISELAPETQYYFKAEIRDERGVVTGSEIFKFKTAAVSDLPEIDTESLIVTSANNILSTAKGSSSLQAAESATSNENAPARPARTTNVVSIPQEKTYEISVKLKRYTSIKKIRAILKNKTVLGLTSDADGAEPNTTETEMEQVGPGVYVARLKAPESAGYYEAYARIEDNKGNVIERKITDVKVLRNLRVYDAKSKKNLENARVFLSLYDSTKKLYKPISPNTLPIKNPSYTDMKGEVSLSLPEGKYEAEISSLGYKDKTVEFTIGPNPEDGFPEVSLEGGSFNPINIARYYLRTANDVFLYNTRLYAKALTGSSRFFDLVAAITLGLLVILSLFSFSKKHHIPLSQMPSYFYYLLDHKRGNEKYVHGVVYDEKDKPIPGANVYLTDKESEKIVSSTKTNRNGEFFFRRGASKYLIMAMVKNYKTSPLIEYHEREHLKFKITLELMHEGLNLFENAIHVVSRSIGMTFEFFLVSSLIFEFLLLNTFGIVRTLPFLSISIFNLILWTLHLRHHHTRFAN